LVLSNSLQFILLPPLAVLFAGVIFGWIVVRGSRAKQHELVLRRDFFFDEMKELGAS
jgi:hypothetical protein